MLTLRLYPKEVVFLVVLGDIKDFVASAGRQGLVALGTAQITVVDFDWGDAWAPVSTMDDQRRVIGRRREGSYLVFMDPKVWLVS